MSNQDFTTDSPTCNINSDARHVTEAMRALYVRALPGLTACEKAHALARFAECSDTRQQIRLLAAVARCVIGSAS